MRGGAMRSRSRDTRGHATYSAGVDATEFPNASASDLAAAVRAGEVTARALVEASLARIAARGPASGIPRMVADAGGLWLAWTDVVEGASRLQGARITR